MSIFIIQCVLRNISYYGCYDQLISTQVSKTPQFLNCVVSNFLYRKPIMYQRKHVTNKPKSGITIGHPGMDNEIAKAIYDRWPKFATQKEIASDLGVPQSLVSKSLSRWTSKNNVPLKVFYDERNIALERILKATYNLKNIVVLKNADSVVHPMVSYKQIGRHAYDILVKKINAILEKKTKIRNNKIKENGTINETKIKISASCGNSVSTTIMNLAEGLEDTDINLRFSSNIALRSNKLIELTPLHFVTQLLNRKLHVEIAHTYQLPEISSIYNNDSLYEIIEQRIRIQKMLAFDNEVLQSDIVIFELGSIGWDSPVTGFMRHINNLHIQSFFNNFAFKGEIAFAPFCENGFLFHNLAEEVFELANGKFRYDENKQMEKLKKVAKKGINVSKQNLVEAALFFSSTFTVNFYEIAKSLQKEIKRPYFLLVAGGEKRKALPLKIILEKWKSLCVLLDELVISENIAKGLLINE